MKVTPNSLSDITDCSILQYTYFSSGHNLNKIDHAISPQTFSIMFKEFLSYKVCAPTVVIWVQHFPYKPMFCLFGHPVSGASGKFGKVDLVGHQR